MSSAKSTAALISMDFTPNSAIEATFSWWVDIAAEIGSFRLSARPPLAKRREFKDLFNKTIHNRAAQCGDFLALLFGSLGRAEPAQDIDLLVIIPGSQRWFRYERLLFVDAKVDLNVTSLTWLREAWADPEWGYCLSEAYLLHSTSVEFEESFVRALRRYGSSQNRLRRRSQHLKNFSELMQAADEAQVEDLNLVGRLLGHEAIRSAAISIIDQFGTRVYSHRSFISELRHAGRRGGVPLRLIETLIYGLTNSIGHAASLDYVEARKRVSEILRTLRHTCGLPYQPGATRSERIETLCQLSKSPAGGRLERVLEQSIVESWLPKKTQFEAAREAAQAILHATNDAVRLQATHSTSSRAVRRSEAQTAPVPHAPVPQKNPTPDARWVDMANGRLKVILSTGGCKTPSCVFCSLPAYGSRPLQRSPAETVGQMLRQYQPKELVLYNDGSLLNPAEVSPEELVRLFDEIGSAEVDSLWLESIPRFITKNALFELLERTRVPEVVIGMGFQCVGNWAAVDRLGRPDADSVFDQAVELLHRMGVKIRLYLLWGHPVFHFFEWRHLLRASIRWANARAVQMITICPFVWPHQQFLEGKFNYSLCELRSALSGLQLGPSVTLQVSLPTVSSCGIQLPEGCANCVATLQSEDWANGQPCKRR